MSLPILSEEDIERMKLAGSLADDDCLSFHKICGAECCKGFYLNYDGPITGETLQIHTVLDKDLAWYFELHGCSYSHGILRVPTRFCHEVDPRIFSGPRRVFVQRTCDYLTEDLRCRGHGIKKPRLCSGLNMKNVRDGNLPRIAQVTPNCLYHYRRILEENSWQITEKQNV